jgi:hypothetical protein
MDTHGALLALAVVIAVGVGAPLPSRPLPSSEELEGRAPTAEELRPSVEAAFQHESYAAGATASLVFFNSAAAVTLQVFHVGSEAAPTVGNDEMQGVQVAARSRVGAVRAGTALRVQFGPWPSGIYFARLQSTDGRLGFAPFVLRPRRLGEHRVAVVMPTMTWEAYNVRDDDGDGKGDSWYADWNVHTARLARPFLDRGVPYHFRNYDLPFVHWLAAKGYAADYLADADLDHVANAHRLARAYDLIVFPGHHEYVTTHEYDVVEGYRNRGGNLAFLSANNFFWQIQKHGDVMQRTKQWRDLGRPEAALIGVEYRGNDDGRHRAPWIVRDAQAGEWLFAGTGLDNGSTFDTGGIEIDKTASASPMGVHVLAEIPNLFGRGFTAQMTYYTTPYGAKVFAAGAFTLAGSVGQPIVAKLMDNLWLYLSRP